MGQNRNNNGVYTNNIFYIVKLTLLKERLKENRKTKNAIGFVAIEIFSSIIIIRLRWKNWREKRFVNSKEISSVFCHYIILIHCVSSYYYYIYILYISVGSITAERELSVSFNLSWTCLAYKEEGAGRYRGLPLIGSTWASELNTQSSRLMRSSSLKSK